MPVLVVSSGLLLTAWIIGWVVFEIPAPLDSRVTRDGGSSDGRACHANCPVEAASASW
jgi:hypothetical protein